MKAESAVSVSTVSPDALMVELEKLRKDNEMMKLNIQELSTTNEFLVSATWREREMKKRLHEALEEIKQHKGVAESINYASRIQDAIIPKLHDLKERFKDVFIYHEAKNIVSGDFPWMFDSHQFTYIAAVDCTGHGVPGAMMSLIGHLLLNDIAKSENIDPASLLNQLHRDVVRTLKQADGGKQTTDGMDVAMVRIDRINHEILFSGAHRPLYHISDGVLNVLAGDKYPIGGTQYKGKNEFTNQFIKVKEGDCIYFFSDGLTDQFGGPEGQKIGPKRIQEILQKNSHLSMHEQHTKIRTTYNAWKGDQKQLDDLLLIGIRF